MLVELIHGILVSCVTIVGVSLMVGGPKTARTVSRWMVRSSVRVTGVIAKTIWRYAVYPGLRAIWRWILRLVRRGRALAVRRAPARKKTALQQVVP